MWSIAADPLLSLFSAEILRHCAKEQRNVEFILVDGDHSAEGVRADINALLVAEQKPLAWCSFTTASNPACREGIKTANWSSSRAVQGVEIDFIPGIYHHEAYDTAEARTMWGGFACAVLEPTERRRPLELQASQQALFDAVYQVSAHAPAMTMRRSLRGLLRKTHNLPVGRACMRRAVARP